MKHMIKWLKITAGINIYLSVIITLVFFVILFAIVSDYSVKNTEYINFLIEEQLKERDQ
jgi:hypothetical protein